MSVEKKMPGGGSKEKSNTKVADLESIELNVENMIRESLKDKYEKQKKPGESYDSWFKRTPKEELLRLNLKDGSNIKQFSDYYKPKEPTVKKVTLGDYFDLNRTVESLTPDERSSLKFLLKNIYKKNKE